MVNIPARKKTAGLMPGRGLACLCLVAVALAHAEGTPQDAAVAETARPEAATQPAFAIMEYRIEGNTVLPAQTVERVVYPHLGEGRTIADVEQARKSLEAAYHKAGYSTVFVDIPEQDVVNGVVRLRVTEGRVGRVRVTGSRYYSLGRIRAQVPALAPGAVPYLPDVQQQMGAVNRAAADRQVTPVFRAGRTPGTVDVELKVRDESPLHASLEANNRYSANTTHTRASAQLRYDNLWQREHSLSLQYQTAPENTDEVRVASATYLFRADDSDHLTALYAVHSRSNVAVVGDISVIGTGDIVGVRRIVPLPPGGRLFHSLSLGADIKDFDESILQGADDVQTPIRYVPLSLSYNGGLAGEKVANQFSAALNFSLRSLSDKKVDCLGQEVDQFECKRYLARPNYLYLRADYRRTQKLPHGMSWLARFGGQLAGRPLISNEQYSVGGADSVRGYLESERLGDDGWQAGLEWRSDSFAGEMSPGLSELRFLIFTEAAALNINEALPDQPTRYRLAGSGAGLRFGAGKYLKGEADWARAHKDGAVTRKGEDRLHFRLEAGF